jgi:hypothetical protein
MLDSHFCRPAHRPISSTVLQVGDGSFKNLIAILADALNRRLNSDMRSNPDALKLSTISVTDSEPGESNGDPSGQISKRDIAICAAGGCPNESHSCGGFKLEAGMLGGALRPFVNEHHDLAPVFRTRRRIHILLVRASRECS